MPELLAGDLIDCHLSEGLAREKGVGTLLTGEVVEVRDKAVKVKVRTVLSARVDKACRLCQQPLTKPASIAIGYGPDCALSLGITNKLIMSWDRMPSPKEMVSLERAVTKTVWLPIRGVTITSAGRAQGADRPAAAKRSEARTAAVQSGLFDLSEERSTAVSDGELPLWVRCGTGDFALLPYQEEGVKRAFPSGRMIIADEMGLGKSAQAIGLMKLAQQAARETGDYGPMVVVCPASVKLNWRKEIRQWDQSARVQVLAGRSARLDPKATHYVVNYDIMAAGRKKNRQGKSIKGTVELSKTAQGILARSPVALVLDESHYLKEQSSQRSLALKELGYVTPYVWPLTGTPLLNKPKELIPLLAIIDVLDSEFGGEDQFLNDFCDMKILEVPLRKKVPDGKGGFVVKEITKPARDADGNPVMAPVVGRDGRPVRDGNGQVVLAQKREPVIVAVKQFNGASNTDLLHRKMQQFMLRRLKRDVMADLPPIRYASVPIELDNRSDYDAYEQEILDADPKKRLGMLGKLRALGSVGKARDAKEWISTFLDGSDQKLVVFIHFRETQQKIFEQFPDALRIFGGMSASARQAAVDAFQADPDQRLILCSLMAAKEGITLTAASNLLVVDQDWVPGNMDQAHGRIHRKGQQSDSVTIWTLLADQTVDERVAEALHDKRIVTGEVLDGTAAFIDEEQVAQHALRDVLARAMANRPKAARKAAS